MQNVSLQINFITFCEAPQYCRRDGIDGSSWIMPWNRLLNSTRHSVPSTSPPAADFYRRVPPSTSSLWYFTVPSRREHLPVPSCPGVKFCPYRPFRPSRPAAFGTSQGTTVYVRSRHAVDVTPSRQYTLNTMFPLPINGGRER